MTLLELRLLGNFEALDKAGKPVDVSAKKNRALLAILALSSSGQISREKLANILWSDREDVHARSSLRQSLASLRRDFSAVDPSLVLADEEKVTLDRARVEIDAISFLQFASSKETEDLRRAMSLYRGELLGDTTIRDPAFEEWVAGERTRLQEIAVTGVEKLWARERSGQRIEVAKRLVALDPLRESSHRALMQAYAEVGENAHALQQYGVCRDLLKTEFGIAPGNAVEKLRQQILGRGAGLTASEGDRTAMLAASKLTAGWNQDRSVNQSAIAQSALVLADKPSIAVLPFQNMSGDPEQEYFADGMTDDIITDLSKVSGLSVIARHSAFTYKGKAADVQEVSRRFNVTTILEGSVRKAGQRVRINAQLIDGKDGTHLWADRYDRDLTDIFAIQDDIAHTIVDQLKVKLLPQEKRAIETIPTASIEAYHYYLRGRALYHLHTISHVLLAQRMFRKAAELDLTYARAYAGLADCAFFLHCACHHGATIAGIYDASMRALEIDPALAEAHASHGIALHHLGRYPEAVLEFERALEIDPNCFEAHYLYAYAAREKGELETSAKMSKRASEMDPEDSRVLFDLAQVYQDLGRREESVEMARRGVQAAERMCAEHPEVSLPLALGAGALVRLGERMRALQWCARALAIAPDDPLTLFNVACCYGLLGELDLTLQVLERWHPLSNPRSRAWIRKDTDFDALRMDTRFQEFLSRLG